MNRDYDTLRALGGRDGDVIRHAMNLERARIIKLLEERVKRHGDIANKICSHTRDPSQWVEFEIRLDECNNVIEAIGKLP